MKVIIILFFPVMLIGQTRIDTVFRTPGIDVGLKDTSVISVSKSGRAYQLSNIRYDLTGEIQTEISAPLTLQGVRDLISAYMEAEDEQIESMSRQIQSLEARKIRRENQRNRYLIELNKIRNDR